MTIFEHVPVFISIILGLALVHLLGGVSHLLDARARVKISWAHLLWTAKRYCYDRLLVGPRGFRRESRALRCRECPI